MTLIINALNAANVIYLTQPSAYKMSCIRSYGNSTATKSRRSATGEAFSATSAIAN